MPPSIPSNPGVSLEKSLSPGRMALLRLAASHAEKRGAALYLVGGFVRDLLLDLATADFDLVVVGDALALAGDLAMDFGGALVTHPRFGTAKWHLHRDDPRLRQALGAATGDDDLPATIDLATARTEVYDHPTALPTVERGGIENDLQRRDFTINTLAIRLDGPAYGELLDPWGGGRDLQNRSIRVLHDRSFLDDPTRVLRAVRLGVRLGFQIDPETLRLLTQSLPQLAAVSGERLRNELDVILSGPETLRMVARLAELHLLSAIHPALDWDGWLEEAFERAGRFQPPETWGLQEGSIALPLRYAVWVIRRSMAEAASWADRLRVSRAEQAVWLQANQLFRELPRAIARGDKVSALTARMEAADALALAAVRLAHSADPAIVRAVETYLTQWRHVRPVTDGRALLELGVPPGPGYRRLLERLRAGWLDGEITSEEQEASARAEWIAQEVAHG
ncbi:MAG: hypothetical protein WD906_03055 [Anaerolineales bacterium]